jgi:hypothetical protein
VELRIKLQFNEIVAGTASAAIGKYFSTHAPLIGKLSDDQTHLEGFEQLEGPAIAARSRDGNVLDAAGEMKTILQRIQWPTDCTPLSMESLEERREFVMQSCLQVEAKPHPNRWVL